MNLEGQFLADLTEDPAREGSFASVQERKDSIVRLLGKCDRTTKPNWSKASGEIIRAGIQRDRQAPWAEKRWIVIACDSLHWDRPGRAIRWRSA